MSAPRFLTIGEVIKGVGSRRFVACLRFSLGTSTQIEMTPDAVLESIRQSPSLDAPSIFFETQQGYVMANFTPIISKSESAREAGEASRPRWTGKGAHYVVQIDETGQPGVCILQENGTVDCVFHLPSVEALAEFVTGWRPGLPDDDLKSLVLRSRRDKPSPQTQSGHNPSDSSPDKS